MTDSTVDANSTVDTVPASKVRTGDSLLVDEYVREVVRVETVASPTQPSESGDAAGEIPVRQLRVCFLNGGSLIVSSTHVLTICRLAQPDAQPAKQPDGRCSI